MGESGLEGGLEVGLEGGLEGGLNVNIGVDWRVDLSVDRLCNLPMRDSSSISLSLELSSATWISYVDF